MVDKQYYFKMFRRTARQSMLKGSPVISDDLLINRPLYGHLVPYFQQELPVGNQTCCYFVGSSWLANKLITTLIIFKVW